MAVEPTGSLLRAVFGRLACRKPDRVMRAAIAKLNNASESLPRKATLADALDALAQERGANQ
jgi:hypothetical protein